jgi:hypothetical protein
MTRGFESRLAKLETKRRIHDDDLTRLTDVELQQRLDRIAEEIATHFGGIDNAIAALRADATPEGKRCADGLEEWKAEREQVQA